MKKISVIVPVYNVAEYLPRCLNSILANSYKDLEIICINDGSKDNSLDILMEYKVKDPRFVVLDTPNRGIAAARNVGLDAATGDYISFVDPDDWIHTRYFEALVHIKETSGASVALCGHVNTRALELKDADLSFDDYPISILHADDCFRKNRNRIFLWNHLYDSKDLRTVRNDASVKASSDLVFYLEALCSIPGYSEACSDIPVYYYFQRDSSIMHSSNWMKYSITLRGLVDLYERLAPDRSAVVLNEAVVWALDLRRDGLQYPTWDEGNQILLSSIARLHNILKHKPKSMGLMRFLALKTMLSFNRIYTLVYQSKRMLKKLLAKLNIRQ